MKHLHLLTLTLLCTFLVFGCSPKTTLSGLVPGKGTVTLDGTPVDKASLTFIPATQTPGARSANAITQPDGSFELMTLQPKDGIFPGEYNVIVWKTEVVITPVPNASSDIKETDLLPATYKTLAATPLKVTIGASGDTAIKIELKN